MLSLEKADAERTVGRYLGLADSLRRRGQLETATQVLSYLQNAGERHNVQNINYVWFNLGELSFEQRDLRVAEGYFDRVVHHGGRDEVVAAAYSRLAALYYMQDSFGKAQFFASEALKRFEVIGDKQAIFRSYVQLASALIGQGAPEGAAEALAKATVAAEDIPTFLLPHGSATR